MAAALEQLGAAVPATVGEGAQGAGAVSEQQNRRAGQVERRVVSGALQAIAAPERCPGRRENLPLLGLQEGVAAIAGRRQALGFLRRPLDPREGRVVPNLRSSKPAAAPASWCVP